MSDILDLTMICGVVFLAAFWTAASTFMVLDMIYGRKRGWLSGGRRR